MLLSSPNLLYYTIAYQLQQWEIGFASIIFMRHRYIPHGVFSSCNAWNTTDLKGIENPMFTFTQSAGRPSPIGFPLLGIRTA